MKKRLVTILCAMTLALSLVPLPSYTYASEVGEFSTTGSNPIESSAEEENTSAEENTLETDEQIDLGDEDIDDTYTESEASGENGGDEESDPAVTTTAVEVTTESESETEEIIPDDQYDEYLELKYDDYLNLKQKYPGTILLSAKTIESKSRNLLTKKPDPVITVTSATMLRATGTGSAEVTLMQNDGTELRLHIEVTPAVLTRIYLAGQSNAEGSTNNLLADPYKESVMNEAGTVYSTYLPSTYSRFRYLTGITLDSAKQSQFDELFVNAKACVPITLAQNVNYSYNRLTYPLDSLTSLGKGKTGPDSGLAYRWNQLTGDKVWVINTAKGQSSIKEWVDGGERFELAKEVFSLTNKTYLNEVAAGHYTEGNCLLVWLQGENNRNWSFETYRAYFAKMYKNMRAAFAEIDSDLDLMGVISVRSSKESNTGADDIYMNGARTAQYQAAFSESYPLLYMVSNVNEQWISDAGVKKYFSGKYGSQLSYPTHTKVSVPTTLNEVHPNVHYNQVAHNENGITAAEGLYHALRQDTTVSQVRWYTETGSQISSANLLKGNSQMIVPVPYPVYAGKFTSIETDNDVSNYTIFEKTDKDVLINRLTAAKNGSSNLVVSAADRTFSLPVTVTTLPSPKVSLNNVTAGIEVKWTCKDKVDGFRIYRRVANGRYAGIATIASGSITSYIDKTAASGVTYEYAVRSVSGQSLSSYSGVSILRLNDPKVTIDNAAAGIRIRWNKIAGAKEYRVYRQIAGKRYEQIARITNASTVQYVDKAAADGTNYVYTVRAVSGSIRSSFTGSNALIRLKAPTVTVKKSSTNAVVRWNKITGAKGYYIYRKEGNGSYKLLTTYTSGTKITYTDKTTKKGKSYTYAVRAYNGSSKSTYTGVDFKR